MCLTNTYPLAACEAAVRSNREISPGIFELTIDRRPASPRVGLTDIPSPRPGQFFMLRARPSGVLLGRPISVYRSDASSIIFLILKKGRGSAELCSLREGGSLDLIGPIGNTFVTPDELVSAGHLKPSSSGRPRVALIGGGIGVAPVAGFALGLSEGSFDFFASFRSAPYGLDGVASRASSLTVTSEDGSAGIKGMLPAVFNASGYDLVYACGPTPMLRFVQLSCRESGSTLAFLSLEERMACGAGACLGCTVRTVNGNRRCCVDGPVFDAAEVML